MLNRKQVKNNHNPKKNSKMNFWMAKHVFWLLLPNIIPKKQSFRFVLTDENNLIFFFIIAGSIDTSQFPSQSTNSLDISIFSDIERLSQEFRQFQSTFGQNVRELTSFKASATDDMERLSENVNELQELVENQTTIV